VQSDAVLILHVLHGRRDIGRIHQRSSEQGVLALRLVLEVSADPSWAEVFVVTLAQPVVAAN
jgi:hypothetical protein